MKRLRRLWRQLMGSCGLLLLTALLFFVAFNSISAAQTTQQVVEEEQAAESEIDVAPVTVDGEDLFMVVGVSAHPAEERAPNIALRLMVLNHLWNTREASPRLIANWRDKVARLLAGGISIA